MAVLAVADPRRPVVDGRRGDPVAVELAQAVDARLLLADRRVVEQRSLDAGGSRKQRRDDASV